MNYPKKETMKPCKHKRLYENLGLISCIDCSFMVQGKMLDQATVAEPEECKHKGQKEWCDCWPTKQEPKEECKHDWRTKNDGYSEWQQCGKCSVKGIEVILPEEPKSEPEVKTSCLVLNCKCQEEPKEKPEEALKGSGWIPELDEQFEAVSEPDASKCVCNRVKPHNHLVNTETVEPKAEPEKCKHEWGESGYCSYNTPEVKDHFDEFTCKKCRVIKHSGINETEYIEPEPKAVLPKKLNFIESDYSLGEFALACTIDEIIEYLEQQKK